MCRHKGAGNPNIRTIDDVPGVHVADVFALASLLISERMGLQTGRICVADDGALKFAPGAAGPHIYATTSLPENSYRCEILRRLQAGCA